MAAILGVNMKQRSILAFSLVVKVEGAFVRRWLPLELFGRLVVKTHLDSLHNSPLVVPEASSNTSCSALWVHSVTAGER